MILKQRAQRAAQARRNAPAGMAHGPRTAVRQRRLQAHPMLAAQTLRNGIEVALRDNIPEITEIVDVDELAAGESPYA